MKTNNMVTNFQTFSSSARPIRLAVLTEAEDKEWQATCLAIIEFLTKLWGGAASIIVPTDGNSIADVFWTILSAHDPDIVCTYRKTGKDLRRNDQKRFDELVAKKVENFTEPSEIEQIRKSVVKGLENSPLSSFGITDGLSQEILKTLAPFHFQKKLSNHEIHADAEPFWPLTSIKGVLPYINHGNQVITIDNQSGLPDLWFCSRIGCATPNLVFELNNCDIPAMPVFTTHFEESDWIRWGVQPWLDFAGKTPFDISQLGLATVRSVQADPFELPTVLVMGDSLEDFCLYYSLLRLHGRAVWIPAWVREQTNGFYGRLMTAVAQAEELSHADGADSVVLTSLSVSQLEMENLVKELESTFNDISVAVVPPTLDFVTRITKHPLRVLVSGSIEKLATYQIVDDQVPGPFESLKPAALKQVNPQDHRWIVETSAIKHRLPRHPALGSFAVAAPSLGSKGARCGAEGLAFLCPGSFVHGTDPDFNMVRPQITLPGPYDLFRIALHDAGYECEISDKGRYEKTTIQKLGGIESAASVCRDSQQRALLNKFLDKNKPGKNVYDDGVPLPDDRRYLNFAAIAKLLGGDEAATTTIDKYIGQEVLYRGLLLKCGNCSNVEWYSIHDVSHLFTCKRCGKEQQYTKANWKHPNEPSWFYKLDEMVYQALLNNSAVPILTLGAIKESCKTSFLFCPELRIKLVGAQKHSMEIDICCVPDGALCIGEAKSNGTLTATGTSALDAAKSYRELAEKLNATTVVFSTTEKKWDDASEKAMAKAFENAPLISVRTLKAEDLKI